MNLARPGIPIWFTGDARPGWLLFAELRPTPRLKLSNQVPNPNLECSRNMKEIHDRHVTDPALYSRDVRPVQIGSFGKLFLGEPQLEPPEPDCLTQRFSWIGDSDEHVPIFSALQASVHSL